MMSFGLGFRWWIRFGSASGSWMMCPSQKSRYFPLVELSIRCYWMVPCVSCASVPANHESWHRITCLKVGLMQTWHQDFALEWVQFVLQAFLFENDFQHWPDFLLPMSWVPDMLPMLIHHWQWYILEQVLLNLPKIRIEARMTKLFTSRSKTSVCWYRLEWNFDINGIFRSFRIKNNLLCFNWK